MKNKSEINNILVVAAHPDDEILGCGGSIYKWHMQGKKIHIIIMAEGLTSRDKKRNLAKSKKDLLNHNKKCQLASKIVGANSLDMLKLPDNRMDTLPFLDIVKEVEKKNTKI